MKYLAEKFGIALLLVVAALLVYFAFFMGPALVPLQGDVLSNGVVVLYNDVLTTGSTNRFVPGSGYIAVYADQDTGSFDFDQVYFELVSGGKQSVASGLQIFERGTLYVERDSEANSSVHLILYYLPHTEVEENTLLSLLQDDPSAFSSYKIEHRHDIDPLCWALRSELTLPQACPEGGGTPPLVEETLDGSGGGLSSDPSSLPELDFSNEPSRRPEINIRIQDRLTFLGEPVAIHLDDVYDPDGKCQFFQFSWQKPNGMEIVDVTIDDRFGDLSFVPQNTGSFTLRVRAQELCEDLGTQISAPQVVRVIVNDKSMDFSDLALAPEYQNSILELYHLGVMKGYQDGTMRPTNAINRAEFLKLIFGVLNYDIQPDIFSARYKDVLPGQWFSHYVFQADVLGVTKGYPDGLFHPEQTVNLVEALKMAMHFTTLEIKDDTLVEFSDVSNHDWFSRYVKTAFREGILTEVQEGGPIYPGQRLTRGKAAQIIVRTLLFPVNRINTADKDVLRMPEEFEDFSSFQY